KPTSSDYQHGSALKPATPPSSSSHSLRRHSAVTSPWSGAFSCCQARFSVLLMQTSSALGLVVTLSSSRKGCRSCWTSYSAGESISHEGITIAPTVLSFLYMSWALGSYLTTRNHRSVLVGEAKTLILSSSICSLT